MKVNGLKLRRSHLLGFSILVLAGAAVLVSNSVWSSVNALVDEHGFEGEHNFQIVGQGEFTAASAESLTATSPGASSVDRNGLRVLPIRIHGMAGRGYAEGIGETMYWMDKSRPVKGSMMRSKARGSNFPAVHEMRFHLLLTTEALPGRTFRSINPAIMVNNNATAFPPKLGSRYVLKQVVELEDVDEPGVVAIRILGNKNRIVSHGWSGRLEN